MKKSAPRKNELGFFRGFHPLESGAFVCTLIAMAVCMVRATLGLIMGEPSAERTDGVMSLIVFVFLLPGLLAAGRRFLKVLRQLTRDLKALRHAS